jgi:DNA helicase-2/ATP-dependent DNA helicase PcrA
MTVSKEVLEIIEHEQAILKGVLETLQEQIQQLIHRFTKEERRARELTSSIVTATNDEDKAMLASDEAVSHALKERQGKELPTLKKQLSKPYFARIVVRERENGSWRDLEYKIGFTANSECRIVDWRKAPVSKLYYEYREGDEYCEQIQGRERNGSVVLRNTVEIEDGVLNKVTCHLGTFIRRDDAWIGLDSSILGRSSTAKGQLPQILALITPEQFQAITEDADTAILVQGIAGSGKTTVELHRLAWLLHEENSPLKPAETIVVVISAALKSYIKETLPSLGVDGVAILTFREWAARTVKSVAPHLAGEDKKIKRPFSPCPTSVARLLKSTGLLKALEEHVRLAAELTAKKLRAAACPGGPALHAGTQIQNLITEMEKNSRPIGSLLGELASLCDNNSSLGCLVTEQRQYFRDFEKLILETLKSPRSILESDDSRLINQELIIQAGERISATKAQRVVDAAVEPLFLRLAELIYGGVFNAEGHPKRYKHLVCDEVQDLSSVELAAIIGAVDNLSGLTLVGDIAQRSDASATFPGWERLRRSWSLGNAMSRYISLEVSHRSTLPIMRLADHVQRRPPTKEGRKGRIPLWFKCSNESKGVRAAIRWLSQAVERYPDALTAVLCDSPGEAKHVLSLLKPTFGPTVRIGDEDSFSFGEGIVVTDVPQVKGLEFFNILIWNPTAKSYPDNDIARNLLYIAITRAEENLCLVTWQRPTPLLPSIYSKLVRGVEVGFEEEE